MATATFGSPIKSVEGETKSLSTTAGYLALKPGFQEIKLYCASQWRMALSPKLLHAIVFDGTNYTEYVQSVIDRSATTHLPLDGMTTSQFCYLGFSEPALGVYFDVNATNKNDVAATLDVEYCSTAVAEGVAIAFTDVAGDSDGTSASSKTLAQDGVYTWTLPGTAWKKSTLGTAAIPLFSKCYWIRFAPSTTLSATIDVEEIIPVYQNTNYSYQEPGVVEQFSLNLAEVGGLVVIAIAGTPTLDVSWIKH